MKMIKKINIKVITLISTVNSILIGRNISKCFKYLIKIIQGKYMFNRFMNSLISLIRLLFILMLGEATLIYRITMEMG